jgi:hypothetical protein
VLNQKSAFALWGQSFSTKEASVFYFLGPESPSSEHKSSEMYYEIISYCLWFCVWNVCAHLENLI